MGWMGGIEQLDATVASLAREETALRLRLGQLLEVIGRGAVFELGFSSLGAYAVERCERSVRWAEGARCLARRLEGLPQLRRAMATGKVSWSMGEVLARVATPASEARWLELAQSRTVRQVRVLVAEAMTAASEVATSGLAARAPGIEEQLPHSGVASIAPGEDDSLAHLQSGSDELCTLTCTVAREDAWLFEATQCLLEHLGTRGAVAQADALLAEAQGTLLASLPEGAIDLDGLHDGDQAQQRWVEQLLRWRDEAEALCEKKVLDDLLSTRTRSGRAERRLGEALAASLGLAPLERASCTELDRQVRALAAALARHELELSRLVLRFHRADGWRKLGYATETQYARERLGLSRSSLAARRALALRLEKLPGVAAALGAAQVGVEAALQLVRIATPETEAAWVERARRRTIKHLREEVAAALTAVRLSGESDCLPPEATDMAAFEALEQTVVSGRFAQPRSPSDAPDPTASPSTRLRHPPEPESEPESDGRRHWRAMLGSLASWLDGALQMSAAAAPDAPAARPCSSAGRVTLRLRMSREAYRWWRSLEAQARRWLPRRVSWLRFLCLSVWHAWRHLLGTDVAYGHIYIRDRFRCTSPVCNRRDVTPHHIQFRSAGGSDEPENLTSPCAWCHLHGIHGGRIRAVGTAGEIHWELGPRSEPSLIVHGRERRVA
jgi:HNH endonuclease